MPDASSTLKLHLSDYEKKLILKTYNLFNKDKEETAKALGLVSSIMYSSKSVSVTMFLLLFFFIPCNHGFSMGKRRMSECSKVKMDKEK